MLPFASGIPNLTPDWTQVTGLGAAATRGVGVESGNVAAYGSYGLSNLGYGGSPTSEAEMILMLVIKQGTKDSF